MTIINNFLCANGKIMKKTLLIAAIVAAGITFAMADDGQPAGRLYKIGEHTVEVKLYPEVSATVKVVISEE